MSRGPRLRARALGAVLLALALPTAARADEPPKEPPADPPPEPPKVETPAEKATRLFQEGQDLRAKGDLFAACERFTESLALGGAVGPRLNLADCEERLGHAAAALDHWEKGLAQLKAWAEPDGERVALASARIASLEKRVARVRVGGGGGRVSLGARELPAVGATALDPGDYVFVITAPGRPERFLRVTLAAGEQRALDATPAPAPLPPPPPPLSGAGITGAGIATLAAGALGFGAFAVTGAMIVERDAQLAAACPDKVCADPSLAAVASEGRTLLGVNAAALGVGIAGVGVGATLLLAQAVAGRRKPAEAPKVAPTAAVGPSGAFVGLGGAF